MTPPRPSLSTQQAILLRRIETAREYAACVELQEQIWGADSRSLVPATLLKIANRIGGVAIGAFDGSDQLLGFVFGMLGMEGGRLIHWSDLLAVRPDVRNLGIGRRLKDLQREAVAAQGVEVICWTYDPLVAVNAYLNLRKLGARVREYVEAMYDDPVTPGDDFGSDRLVVARSVDLRPGDEDESIPAATEEPLIDLRESRIVNPGGADLVFRAEGTLRVEVPADIAALRQRAPEEAILWRRSTRKAFQTLLAEGYTVSSFLTDPASNRWFYCLTHPDAT